MSEHYCMYKDGMCELDIDEAYQQGRADAIDEVWNTLIKYQRAIENANYPFNFIQIAFDEVREQLKEQHK